jgi:elongation factor Ts
MEITTDIIKQLRELTGVSVMQCKKALEEAGGDITQAEVILKKRSAEAAAKKAERTLKAGVLGMYSHEGAIGAMVVLSCESDFVAKNPEFEALARNLAMQITATDPLYISVAEIPSEVKNAAIVVFQKEIANKPADMQEKILEGKLSSYFQDQVLLEQPFIKDEGKKVRDLLNEATQKFGERIEVSRFARLSLR